MKDDAKTSGKVIIPLVKPYLLFVLALAMFVGCSIFLFYRASTNDRGLILNGVIEFGPDGADIFYAVLGVLSVGMSGIGALALYHLSRIEEFRILIGKKTVKVPPAVLWKGAADVSIPLDQIIAIEVQPPAKPAVIAIHENGEVHRIPTRWLSPAWRVQEVVDLIMERARQARKPKGAENQESINR